MDKFEEAQYYVGSVGTDFYTVGSLQLEVLKKNGAQPDSHVLEIGCGCLVAGRPILEFLKPDRYVGIEPNPWLIEAAIAGLPETKRLIDEKRPVFLQRTDFDASSVGRRFDFVISHSVLSHAAHWQCPQFFKGVQKVLSGSGVAIASLRFYDKDNNLMGDSLSANWVYPDVSYFSWESIQKFAAEANLAVEWRTDYREFFVSSAPSHYHDWIRIRHLRPF